MEGGVDATRRRLQLLAEMIQKFQVIQRKTPEGHVLAEKARSRMREATMTLATSAALLLDQKRIADVPIQRYQQMIGCSGALPALEAIAAEIRQLTARATGDAPPDTPDRADAWRAFQASTRLWDQQAKAASEELTVALAPKAFGAAGSPSEGFGSEKDALEDGVPVGGALSDLRGDAEALPDERRGCGDQSVVRHFERWMRRILGHETHGHVSLAGEKIRKLAEGDRVDLKRINVYQVRKYLERLRYSSLYPFVASVMRCVSGVSPPSVPQSIIDRASTLFTEVISVRTKVLKLKAGVNSYSYFIYKIFESILSPSDVDNRRILFYIHLQKLDTLESHDREWEQVCRHIPSLATNTPTSRHDALRYAPRDED